MEVVHLNQKQLAARWHLSEACRDVAPTSLQLALARGHRWLAMLESGEAKSLKEIARGKESTTATPGGWST